MDPWEHAFDHPRPASFYARDTLVVARDLLGDRLVSPSEGGWRAGRIVETEAYVTGDPASHAYRGPTPRNQSMFRGPGTLYVYRIHQVFCANITTRPGEAVLLRALEPLTAGLGDTRGPGRLCREFGLTRTDDGSSVVTGARCRVVPGIGTREAVERSPRVGIRRAQRRLLRFSLEGNPWVSRPRPGARPRSPA